MREWRGTPLAERSSQEWAALARAANLQGHGGRIWVDTVMPASALPDYRMVGDIYHEYYWGATELRKHYGREPRFLPNAPGLFQLEEMLYQPDFSQRLRQADIRHMNIITAALG